MAGLSKRRKSIVSLKAGVGLTLLKQPAQARHKGSWHSRCLRSPSGVSIQEFLPASRAAGQDICAGVWDGSLLAAAVLPFCIPPMNLSSAVALATLLCFSLLLPFVFTCSENVEYLADCSTSTKSYNVIKCPSGLLPGILLFLRKFLP